MTNADKGHIEIVNGSIGDLIFRIETLTSDRDTIKVCVRAANELTALKNQISRLTADNEYMNNLIQNQGKYIAVLNESNTRLQATYDHVEEINLRYAEHIQTLTAANEAMQEDTDRKSLIIFAKEQEIAELTRMLFAIGKQDGQTIRNLTEENRGLRQMLHMEPR